MMNSIIDTITGSNTVFFSILGVLLLIIIVMILLIRKENKKKVEDKEDERIMQEVNDALKVVEEKEITDTVAIPTVEQEQKEEKEAEPQVPSENVEATDENAPLSLSEVVSLNDADIVEQPPLPKGDLQDIQPNEISFPDIINEHVESPDLASLNPAPTVESSNTPEDKMLEAQIDAFATRTVEINNETEDPEINEEAIEPVQEKVVPTIEEAFEKMHQTPPHTEDNVIKPAIEIEEVEEPEPEQEEKTGETLKETLERVRKDKQQIVEITPEENELTIAPEEPQVDEVTITPEETEEPVEEQHGQTLRETLEQMRAEREKENAPEEDPIIPEIIASQEEPTEEVVPEENNVEEVVPEEPEEVVLAPTIDLPEEEEEQPVEEEKVPPIQVEFTEEPKPQGKATFFSSVKPVGVYEEVPEYKSEVQYTTTIPIINRELPTEEEKEEEKVEEVQQPVVEEPNVETPIVEENVDDIYLPEDEPVEETTEEPTKVEEPVIEENKVDDDIYLPEDEPEEEKEETTESTGPSLRETMELMRMRKVEPSYEDYTSEENEGTVDDDVYLPEDDEPTEEESTDRVKVVEEEKYEPAFEIPEAEPAEEEEVEEEEKVEEPIIPAIEVEEDEDESDESSEGSSNPFRYLEDTQEIKIPIKEEPIAPMPVIPEEQHEEIEEPNTDEEDYYDYQEDNEEPVEGITLSELSGEKISDNNLEELKDKLTKLEQEQPKVAHMTPYEVEQEEKAIISYDELKKQNDNVSIEYQEQEEINPEVDIKQVDLEKTGKIELDPIKKALNSKVDNSQYGHEEEFLDTLKQLNDLLK